MLGHVSEYAQERKGFWREPDGTPTAESVALEAWARAAHEILITTAETYHGVIREPEIAEELQATTGIRTTRPFGRWLDKVLGPVSKYCEMSGEPPLTSLVVGQNDDLYAARLRLECYRWAGSAPAGGGEPAPLSITVNRPPRAARATRTAREPKAPAPKRVAKSDKPIAVCPSCFMALPATGICDNCG
jgi:hypothetical protein